MVLSKAPVRLSISGGGTDIASYYKKYGGFLISTSIDKYIYTYITKRFDNLIKLNYFKNEIIDNINDIEHKIIKETLKYFNIKNNIEITCTSDVPVGCGLGSSSAFTVSLVNSILKYINKDINKKDIAEIACDIEINKIYSPIGKQDQYASSIGNLNCYTFNKDGSVEIEQINIKPKDINYLEKNLMLFYLGKERSANDILSVQVKHCHNNDNNVINRLHKIKEIAYYTKSILEKGNIDEFGLILHEHWLNKKKISNKISDSYIDEIYDIGLKNGALGGKVVGAGGGGFLLFYCSDDNKKVTLINEMNKHNLKYMPFKFEKEGVRHVNF